MLHTMYKKTLFLCLLLLAGTGLLQVQAQKQQNFNQKGQTASTELFSPAWEPATKAYGSEVRGGVILNFDAKKAAEFLKKNTTQFSLELPTGQGDQTLTVNMYRSDIFAEGFQIFTSSDRDKPFEYKGGLHFHGTVEGDAHSKVAISVFDNEVMGLIITHDGTYNLGRVKNSVKGHILYLDRDLLKKPEFSCSVEDDHKGYTQEELSDAPKAAGDCIRVYLEVDKSVVDNKGSVVNATNYVIGAFNQNVLIYNAESINMTISEMFVWNTPDPYSGPGAGAYLNQFQANTGAFNGDLGHLVAMVNNGGIAAGFSGICNPDRDESLCYSGILNFYNNVPVFSFTVMILAHEMGHLIGSRHTHACVWNGNNTAIDGCSGFVETDVANCPLPGSPAGGGTIMSYCHNDPVGVNFNLGFGLQPGNVIRNTVANAACLPASCTGCDVAIGIVVVINETCPNANNGSITVNATTSAGPLTYAISGPVNQSNGTGVFTNLPDGNYNITVTDNGVANCEATSSATVAAGVDNTPPVPVCRTATVTLNATGNYTLLSADVLNLGASSDNCGTVNFVSASPASVSCAQVGQTIPVTVTVNDGNGNTATCTAQITVQQGTALPAGWSNANIGNANGSAIYKPCTSNGQFTLTSTGFSGNPDLQHSAWRSLCGNGSITARVASVNNGGWAGIEVRENAMPGSKKVTLKTQLNAFVRRVLRSTTNGMAQNQQFPLQPGHDWLRITRTGNSFQLLTSLDGVAWQPVAPAVSLTLPNCVQIGIFAESINVNTTTTAVFDNVTVIGGIAPLATPGNSIVEAAAPDLQVYPNPAVDEITVNLKAYENRPVRLELYDIQGKVLEVVEVNTAENTTERFDLSGYHNGIYLIRAQSEGLPDATKRVVVHGGNR
ncbi:MAG: M12 family metallo-peptidase [Saprospiraceae bacterium]